MNGVLPVDKPEGPTSHDIVAAARRGLGTRRIGHTGTLDPFATGLLLLCVGRSTRIAEYLTGLDKGYEATARLGVHTDTLDRTGEVVGATEAWRELDDGRVRFALESQVGVRSQRPPAYSAKKVGGRRAHELARSGAALDLEPVEVRILELRVLEIDLPDVRFTVRCSSGTYIRSIAADAGEALGVGAHLTELRRTGIGAFTLDGALPAARLADRAAVDAALIPPLRALGHLPAVDLGGEEAEQVRHGRAVEVRGRAPAGLVALAWQARLLAVAESDGASLRPRKVLA